MWAINLFSLGNKLHVLGTAGLISIDNRVGAADSYLGFQENFMELTRQIFSVYKKIIQPGESQYMIAPHAASEAVFLSRV